MLCLTVPQYLSLVSVVLTSAINLFYNIFVKDYPLVLSSEVLSQEVPYLGGKGEMNFYVEGLRFPDKDFNGLISINLSLLEPISTVRSATQHNHDVTHLYIISYYEFLMLVNHLCYSIELFMIKKQV